MFREKTLLLLLTLNKKFKTIETHTLNIHNATYNVITNDSNQRNQICLDIYTTHVAYSFLLLGIYIFKYHHKCGIG